MGKTTGCFHPANSTAGSPSWPVPVVSYVRAQWDVVKVRDQSPHLLTGAVSLLRRVEQDGKYPLRLHDINEARRIARQPLDMRRCQHSGKPLHTVIAEGPSIRRRVGRNVIGSRFIVEHAETMEEAP